MVTDKYNQRWVMDLATGRFRKYAVTIGRTTYYSCPESEVGPSWRRHEEQHKEQWRRDGFVPFLIKYLWYHLTRGYDRNPYEIEAKLAENYRWTA